MIAEERKTEEIMTRRLIVEEIGENDENQSKNSKIRKHRTAQIKYKKHQTNLNKSSKF